MRSKFYFFILLFHLLLYAACNEQGEISATISSETKVTLDSTKVVDTRAATEASPIKDISILPPGVELDSLRGIMVTFWHPWTGEAESVLNQLTETFNQENAYDIEVIPKSQGSDLFESVGLGINTGDYPQMVLATTYELLAWQDTRAVLVDLNPYVKMPDVGFLDDQTEDFHPLFWNQDLVSGGVRFGIPTQAASTLMAYNQTWGKELGFDSPPGTLTEFRDQACTAAAASIGGEVREGLGGVIAYIDPPGMMSWIMAYSGSISVQAGGGYDFDSPVIKDAFVFVKSLFEEGCAWNPETPYSEEEFSARKGLFYATAITELPYITDAFSRNNPTDEWTILTFPTEDGDGVVNVWPYSYAILESSPERQLAAWLYLVWLVSPQNQAAMADASSMYPTRYSAMDFLKDEMVDHPQWNEAQQLLANGMLEPNTNSWIYARWAIGEAGQMVISPDFSSDDIPSLLSELNTLLAEIQIESP